MHHLVGGGHGGGLQHDQHHGALPGQRPGGDKALLRNIRLGLLGSVASRRVISRISPLEVCPDHEQGGNGMSSTKAKLKSNIRVLSYNIWPKWDVCINTVSNRPLCENIYR